MFEFRIRLCSSASAIPPRDLPVSMLYTLHSETRFAKYFSPPVWSQFRNLQILLKVLVTRSRSSSAIAKIFDFGLKHSSVHFADFFCK